jgi:Tfp pilus assembly PilM family ATPase
MKRFRTMPLGVDIGSTRARIALAEQDAQKEVRVLAVASRDISEGIDDVPALLSALLEEMLAELGVRERRCVAALGGSDTMLRGVQFPSMSWHERVSAGRFEFQAGSSETERSSVVRVHPLSREKGAFFVGVAPKDAVHHRASILKRARLKPVALDHDALALHRAIPLADAILDIGAERSTLHVFQAGFPYSYHAKLGGAEVTRGIARELSIDAPAAERRKRILGSAGTGRGVREPLVSALAQLVERARARSPLSRVSLVGNGARLPGLGSELEAATGALVEMPVSPLLDTDAYPEDVVRAAAPDWALAAALTTWRLA